MSPYLTFIYQDDDIVVLNKPSGLLSVTGNRPAHKDALSSRVQNVYPGASVVHRLDWATSGVIVMAMHKDANRHLSRQFHLRQTKKRYFASVQGVPEQKQGKIELPLAADPSDKPKQQVDWENGKPSLTYFTVIYSENDESLVELLPVTGRSHQLRVHMAAIGHPILGDRLYAPEQTVAKASRLQLHAETLIIRHPGSDQIMRFSAPIPFLSFKPQPFDHEVYSLTE